MSAEEIMEKAGAGLGTQIGYTTDGQVFIAIDTKGADDQPMQTIVQWTPKEAKSIANTLLNSAKIAAEQKVQ